MDKGYVALSYFLVMALIAMGLVTAYVIIKKLAMTAVIILGVVFLALLVMFVLMVRSRRKLAQQRIQNERYPYTGVDKKSIDKIFDLIADEERKREKLDLFAAKNTSPAQVRSAAPARSAEPEAEESMPIAVLDSEPEKNVTQETAAPQSEEEDMASILDEELNDVEIRMRAMDAEVGEESNAAVKKSEKSAEESEGGEEPRRKKRPADPDAPRRSGDPSRRPQGQGKRPPQGGKKRPPEGARPPRDPRDPRAPQQGAKKRRPPAGYDPYYGAPVYYDEYGRPIRPMPAYDPYYGAPVYYDEYGQPIRRQAPAGAPGGVYYDEYGRPVRRRPPAGYDPRREEGAKRKRPAAPGTPGAEEQRRRPAAPAQSGAARGSKAPAAPSIPNPDVSKRTAAPVAMPSLKSDFDEEYVPVSIAYDEESSAQDAAEHGVALRANQGRRTVPAAPPKPVIDDESDYSPTDLEAVPIVIPDDEYNPGYEEEVGAPVSSYGGTQGHSASKPNVPDYYYAGDEDDTNPRDLDEGVIVVHDFDDIDQDEYDARYSRDYGSPVAGGASSAAAAAKQSNSYSVEEEDYSYDDEEGVVVLPRDENYEEYLQKVKEEEERKRIEEEKKRAEERRLERKKNGRVALTIRRVRRKKIARKSRKYKRFRASVVPLIKYLHDYDD